MTLRLNVFSWMAGIACLTGAALSGCEGSDGAGASPDAGSTPGSNGDDGFGESEDPIDIADASGGQMPGSSMDAGTARDAGKSPDAGKRVDAGREVPTYDDDCEEEFVFDPSGIDNVTSVVLTGDYSRWTSWVPTPSRGAFAMTLGSDGLYRVRLSLDQEVFQYKFVVNGDSPTPTWLPDAANCHSANDNYGGRNSIRYACQMAPMCEEPTDPDAGAKDAGPSLDASITDAATEDAATKDAATGDAAAEDAATEDAGDPQDGGANEADAGDAGSAMDADVADDAGEEPEEEVDVELGDDCVETFEVDPADYPELKPIVTVELRGDAPLSYDEAVIALHEDADGIFRATARVDKMKFKYNVVLNGKDFVRDRGYCPSADDGFGGRGASLRSTCEVPACCEAIEIAYDPAASSCVDVESVAFVGQLASWGKPGTPMTLGEDGKFRITFRDAPGTYEYKVLVEGAYIAAPDNNCADDGEAAMVVKACVN